MHPSLLVCHEPNLWLWLFKGEGGKEIFEETNSSYDKRVAQTDQRYFDVEISSCSREERSVLPLLVTVAAQEVDGRYQTRIEPLKSYFATLTGRNLLLL